MEERLIHYQIAVSVFSRWLEEGVLSKKDFIDVEAAVAQKYELTEVSIYRNKTCY